MEQEKPFFSIIVPTYNRPERLADCLKSLSRLDYPRDRFEVIVVDDGSQVKPEAVVAPFLGRLNVTLLTQKHSGPGAARNNGATRARGEFLAFTDSDCMPVSNWLQNMAARFAMEPDHAIGGRTLNFLSDNLYSTASQVIRDVVYTYYNTHHDKMQFFPSSNLAMPADRFLEIGGFDPTFTRSQDRELCDRWQHHGFQMTFAPEVLVHHAHAYTFHTFWRRYFNGGRFAFRFHQTAARRGSGRLRVDSKFYLNLFRNRFLQERGGRALWVTVLLVISQVANAIGFYWEWLRQPMEKK
jgi:glycosyltransferase involved in cell wall biosynthesis